MTHPDTLIARAARAVSLRASTGIFASPSMAACLRGIPPFARVGVLRMVGAGARPFNGRRRFPVY